MSKTNSMGAKEKTRATIVIIENEDGTVNIETVFKPEVSEEVEHHLAADVAIAMIEGVFGENTRPDQFGPGGELPQ